MRVLGNMDDGGPKVRSGADFPASPRVGDIFEKTGDAYGPYYWTSTEWKLILTDSVAAALGYTPVNRAGDSFTGPVSFPKAANNGLKVDSTFPWRSMFVPVTSLASGSDAPVVSTFISGIRGHAFSASDTGDAVFVLPNDYVPGSDLYIRAVWGHNGTSISGSFILNFKSTVAKGYGQAVFHAVKTQQLVINSLSLVNAPQYVHRTDEVQLSTPSGSATLLNSSNLEPECCIHVGYVVDTIPTISGSSYTDAPYIFGIGLHYRSNNLGTYSKAPDFFA